MDIVNIARTWIGTKFHYKGRIKKNNLNSGGIDCIGLIVKVLEEGGYTILDKNIIEYDRLDYSRYPNNFEMKNIFDKYFEKINNPKLGDIVYFNFNDNLEHIAILTDIGIIHCYTDAGMVVEHQFDEFWKKRVVCYYSLKKTIQHI